MRVTRAKAADLAENLHIDEDAVLDLNTFNAATPEPDHARKPLGEIAANRKNDEQDDAGVDIERKSSGNKIRKGAKKGSNKNQQQQKEDQENIVDLAASTTGTPPSAETVTPDTIESLPSPASRAASDDLIKEDPECKQPCASECEFSSKSHDANAGVTAVEMSHLPVHDMRPQSPPSPAVRLTRSQLRKTPVVIENGEPKVQVEEQQTESEKPKIEESSLEQNGHVKDIPEAVAGAEKPDPLVEAPVSAHEHEMPNNLQNLRASSRASIPTKNGTSTTIDQSGSMEQDHPGEMSTYDELEAKAVEAQASPSGSNKGSQASTTDPITALDALDDAVEKVNSEVPEVQASPAKPKAKKSAPVVRTTKAAQARISLAHGPKDSKPSFGVPRASMSGSQSAARRVTSISSDKGGEQGGGPKKEAIIPHSKPRPISMKFPTPPPPPKSTKAPTKSTFQLPGEAIAAKLKAAKEARLAKEAEEAKKKTFKARPAPIASKAPAVRQTSTSKARESLMGGKPPPTNALAASHKRASSVAGTRPSMSSSARPSMSKPLSAKPSSSGRLSTAPAAAPKITKRPSTAMASLTNKPRPSTVHSGPTTFSGRPLSTVAAPSKTSAKGKEVFNRVAQAKSNAEKEKREKEEAAKKARAEAAERSRQLSRVWAEKQKMKKAGGGVKPTVSKEKSVAQALVKEVENEAPEGKVEG